MEVYISGDISTFLAHNVNCNVTKKTPNAKLCVLRIPSASDLRGDARFCIGFAFSVELSWCRCELCVFLSICWHTLYVNSCDLLWYLVILQPLFWVPCCIKGAPDYWSCFYHVRLLLVQCFPEFSVRCLRLRPKWYWCARITRLVCTHTHPWCSEFSTAYEKLNHCCWKFGAWLSTFELNTQAKSHISDHILGFIFILFL